MIKWGNSHMVRAAISATVIGLMAGTGAAEEMAAEKGMAKPAMPPVKPSPAAAYCTNVGDAADEARAAWRLKLLKEMEAKIEQRMAALDARRQQVEAWMRRREAFIEQAQKSLVDIYTKMRPDASAQQLSVMDDHTAAAILLKLNPRTASAILNEIQPARAARLASVIAGSARKAKATSTDEGEPEEKSEDKSS
ncbi:MAG: MotE family protein [Aestuariivirgaceae bacterium]